MSMVLIVSLTGCIGDLLTSPDLSVEHPAFPLHRLRVVEPHVCDPDVKQLSGYLDISETRHLFFWFQESRDKPKEDPLVLWCVYRVVPLRFADVPYRLNGALASLWRISRLTVVQVVQDARLRPD